MVGNNILNWAIDKYSKIPSVRESKIMEDFIKIREYREYSPNTISLGIDKFTGSEFKISFKKSKDIIVIGPKGSGKTIIQSGLVDRCYLSGMNVMNVDIKGEYIYKNLPLQEKFNRKPYLLRGEEPTGIDVVSIYFKFLQRMTKYKMENKDNEQFMTMPFQNLNWTDLKAMINTNSDNVNNLLDVLAAKNISFINYKEFEEYLESVEFLHPSSKSVLISRVKMLLEYGVFEENKLPEFSIVDHLNSGKFLNINLRGAMKTWDASTSSILSNYLSSLIMQLYNAKQMGELKKRLLISVDEAPVFAPRKENTSTKEAILKILRLGRSEGISFYASGQDWSYIPEDFLRQADLIFFSYKTSVNDLMNFISEYFSSFIKITTTCYK